MSAENDYAVGSGSANVERAGNSNSENFLSQGRKKENILNGNKNSIETSSIPIVSAAVVQSSTANSAHIGAATPSSKAAAKTAACNDNNQE